MHSLRAFSVLSQQFIPAISPSLTRSDIPVRDEAIASHPVQPECDSESYEGNSLSLPYNESNLLPFFMYRPLYVDVDSTTMEC